MADYPGFRVGICWRGNREHIFDAQRTLALSAFAPLAGVPGVRLISLQKGATDDELAQAGFEVLSLESDGASPTDTFSDAAAVIQQLDLVVTVDTSVAHLAGGLAAPDLGLHLGQPRLALATHRRAHSLVSQFAAISPAETP